MSILRFAALPLATAMLIGVANPKAQGQVIINTLVALSSAKSKSVGDQTKKVITARPKVVQTK